MTDARLFHFGISLSHYKADHLDNESFLHYNADLNVEVPENFDVMEHYKHRLKSVCQLFPLSLTKSIAEQSPRIVDGFINQLHSMIDKYNGRQMVFVLDIDLEQGVNDAEAFERRCTLLRRLTHKLYHSTITIGLAVRVPASDPASEDICLKYLTALSSEHFKLCVDVHPHQIGRDPDCRELLKWVKYDLAAVRVVYTPQDGNFLVTKAIRPWCEFLEKVHYAGTLFFAPMVTSEHALFDEINNCVAIVDELHTT